MSESNTVIEKATALLAEGRVVSVSQTNELIYGTVLSSDGEPYTPFITKGSGGVCGCAYQALKPGPCKHLVALLMAIPIHDLITWVARGEPQ